MKKLALILIAALLLTGILAVLPHAEGKTVYVSAAGDDANDGSEGSPVYNLLRAYEILGSEGGTVCLIGDAKVHGEYRALMQWDNDADKLADGKTTFGPVKITSKDNKTLEFDGTGIWFPSDTEIDNITIKYVYKDYNLLLVANCHKLTIGENVSVVLGDGVAGYPLIYGGGYYSFKYIDQNGTADSNVVVNGGHFHAVYGGGGANGRAWGTHVDDVLGNTNVTINGGEIDEVYSAGNGSVGGTEAVVVKGDTNVTVNGGKIGKLFVGGQSAWAVTQGNANVTVKGGEIGSVEQFVADDGNGMIGGQKTLNCYEEYKDLGAKFDTVNIIEKPTAPDTADITVLFVTVAAAAAAGAFFAKKKEN